MDPTLHAEPGAPPGLRATLTPLAVDVALPLAAQVVVAHLGGSTIASLTAGAVIPVVRTVGSVAFGHRLNQLAALMLAASVAGIVAGLIVGEPRLVVAKDGLVSATIAVGMLLSARRGTPVMSAGLLPFVTRGEAAKVAAWERLSVGSASFRTLERRYTAVWGVVLLADCAMRAVGAFVVPEAWLTWFGGVVVVVALVVGAVVGGALVVEGLTEQIDTEVAR